MEHIGITVASAHVAMGGPGVPERLLDDFYLAAMIAVQVGVEHLPVGFEDTPVIIGY